jgi:hypothetical protein
MKTYCKRPWRSPIEIPALLKDYYLGKIVTHIGCSCGDFIPIWAQYAKQVYGYEPLSDEQRAQDHDHSVCPLLRWQGKLENVKLFNETVEENNLPPVSDLYYFWVNGLAVANPLINLLKKNNVNKQQSWACTYVGVSPRTMPKENKLTQPLEHYTLFRTQEELENWATDLIYFVSEEPDNRGWFDNLHPNGKKVELTLAIFDLNDRN